MGQKISPLSIRTNNNYIIWTHFEEYSLHYKIRNYIINFLNKKGLLINNLNIKKDNNTLYIDLNFIISKSSNLYIKRFRKLVKRKNKLKNRFSHINYNSLNFFLKTLARIYNVKKVYFKATRLDIKINPTILNMLLIRGQKLGLNKQLRNKYIKDLIVVLTLLLQNPNTKAFLLSYILAKHFTWLPKKQHKRFFIFLRDLFKIVYELDKQKNNYIVGIKLLVSGKISGKTQASNFRSIVGSVFNQTIERNVDYATQISFNKLGTFGWKLWISKN